MTKGRNVGSFGWRASNSDKALTWALCDKFQPFRLLIYTPRIGSYTGPTPAPCPDTRACRTQSSSTPTHSATQQRHGKPRILRIPFERSPPRLHALPAHPECSARPGSFEAKSPCPPCPPQGRQRAPGASPSTWQRWEKRHLQVITVDKIVLVPIYLIRLGEISNFDPPPPPPPPVPLGSRSMS